MDAAHVLQMGDGLEVRWIHAGSDFTEVIDFVSGRDLDADFPERDAMCVVLNASSPAGSGQGCPCRYRYRFSA